jgi:uncharacterized protein (DUF2249 family)
MDFEPVISPDLKLMDPRIYVAAKMGVRSELFGTLEERCTYHEQEHTMYLDMFGIMINSEEDIQWLVDGVAKILQPLVANKGPIAMVVNYDGFDLRKGLEDKYAAYVAKLQQKYYKSAKRFHGKAFKRAQLGKAMVMSDMDPKELYEMFDSDKDGKLSIEEIRQGMEEYFNIRLTGADVDKIQQAAKITIPENESLVLDSNLFAKVIKQVLGR